MTVHGGLVGVIPTTVASVSVYPHLRIFANMHTCVRMHLCARPPMGKGREGGRAGEGEEADGRMWVHVDRYAVRSCDGDGGIGRGEGGNSEGSG